MIAKKLCCHCQWLLWSCLALALVYGHSSCTVGCTWLFLPFVGCAPVHWQWYWSCWWASEVSWHLTICSYSSKIIEFPEVKLCSVCYYVFHWILMDYIILAAVRVLCCTSVHWAFETLSCWKLWCMWPELGWYWVSNICASVKEGILSRLLSPSLTKDVVGTVKMVQLSYSLPGPLCWEILLLRAAWAYVEGAPRYTQCHWCMSFVAASTACTSSIHSSGSWANWRQILEGSLYERCVYAYIFTCLTALCSMAAIWASLKIHILKSSEVHSKVADVHSNMCHFPNVLRTVWPQLVTVHFKINAGPQRAFWTWSFVFFFPLFLWVASFPAIEML